MNDLSNLPGQSAARGSEYRFFDLFRLTAELSAILSFVAFALSVWLNSIVFAHWGQDFLQLASPTDVLMSGVRLFGYFLGPLLIAFALATIFPILNAVAVDDKQAPKRLYEKLFIYGVYLIVFMLFIFPLIIGGLWLSGKLDVRNPIYFYLGAGTFGFAVTHIYSNVFQEQNPWAEIQGTVAAAIIGLVGLALVIGWFDARVAAQARNGFHPTALAVFANGVEICPGSRVLWSGSQSTIVECNSGQNNSRIIILRDGESVVLQPSQAATGS